MADRQSKDYLAGAPVFETYLNSGARQCALKGVSHSGLETSARQAVSCGTGSEFCVVHGNMHCEA